MKRFSFLNNVTGWAVFAIATVCYLMTIEPTASFWDCGEFIASANGLEVGHPPGAPLWMLISRLFVIFFGEGNEALAVNVESALASSFTVLFLFWSISHLARKFFNKDTFTQGAQVAVLGASAVGALAYAFSDSFWFSAVEGEVYALSSLFTAAVFWAILKWESLAHRGGEMRWILLIAYLMGLSIGVHLLNLLAIPAICLVYYFKRYEFSWKGVAIALGISGLLLGLVLSGVIKGLINVAAQFELVFVNDLGMGFNTGVLVYGLLVLGGLGFLVYFSRRKGWVVANTLGLSVLVIILGYSSFALVVIRSAANPPMDENNPENLFTLLSYLNREQYGDRPLLTGHYFNTPTLDDKPQKDGDPSFIKSFSVWKSTKKGDRRVQSFRNEFDAQRYIDSKQSSKYFLKKEYIDSGEKKGALPNFDERYTGTFPRMYSSQANHLEPYKEWSDYKGWRDLGKRMRVQQTEALRDSLEDMHYQIRNTIGYYQNQGIGRDQLEDLRKEMRVVEKKRDRLRAQLLPTFGEDMRYLMNYQVGHMYWRYFMWNFAGRQNDKQGRGNIIDGNWLSGVSMIDAERLGNRDRLPETALMNKGYNKFFLLPLILGLIGLVFQAVYRPKDFTVVGFLFLLTGLAIVIYLNQTPEQPRERDYAYVGSFYAFALWIGLSVVALYEVSRRVLAKDIGFAAAVACGAGAAIYVMESLMSSPDHAFSYTLLYMAIVASAALAVFGFGARKLQDTHSALLASILCLVVPVIMASEGWDDHNRAKRSTGVDFAKNYLDSLEPNAILFTNGDNDTFPLWYVQEVEGYRTDVRVVNLSLLNTDWYIDQMKRKAYNSDPVPFSIPEQKYRQGTRDVIYIYPEKEYEGQFVPVSEVLEYALDDKNYIEGQAKKIYSFPTNRLSIPIDSARIVETGTVDLEDANKIVPEIRWQIPNRYITKNSMMLLDLIRTNNWERPIYFAVTTGNDAYIGLGRHFQLEGLAYRLVPIRTNDPHPLYQGTIDTDRMYTNVMDQFQWGGMDDTTGIYLDENNLRMVTNMRLQMANLAEALIEENKEDKAKKVMDYALQVMPEKNVPYDQVIFQYVKNYYAMTTDSSMIRALGMPPGTPVSNLDGAGVEDARATGAELLLRLFELQEDEVEYYSTLDAQYAMEYRQDMKNLNIDINKSMIDVLRIYDPQSELIEQLQERLDASQELFELKEDEFRGRRIGLPADF
ncbi:MAG: DUF2723 domain-containing protein [Flavobacteriales bacterium]